MKSDRNLSGTMVIALLSICTMGLFAQHNAMDKTNNLASPTGVDLSANLYTMPIQNRCSESARFTDTLSPPTALIVNPLTLQAAWLAPDSDLEIFDENWSTGSFASGNWTFEPAQGNWNINPNLGNPAPSVQFNWSPAYSNYSHALVSQPLNAMAMPNMWLTYDLLLSNNLTSTLEQLAVEVWTGVSWVQIANHTNASGNIPWTTFNFDISSLTIGKIFQLRFRANGSNSYHIHNWSLDNIKLHGQNGGSGNPNVVGYYLYLDDVMAGFTSQTTFTFDPLYLNYGQSHVSRVRAVYQNGLSLPDSHMFTSQFLYKPCNLEGIDFYNGVLLTWQEPGTCAGNSNALDVAGYNIYRGNNLLATVGAGILSYPDSIFPGYFTYSITALYNYAGSVVESAHEGPVNVFVPANPSFYSSIVWNCSMRQPLAGVTVKFGPISTISSPNGSFTLITIIGIYDLVFEKNGYATLVIPDWNFYSIPPGFTSFCVFPVPVGIPWEETFASNNFATNEWTFEPGQGNWKISSTAGNPAPGAEFYWSPEVTNYSYTLCSREIDISGDTYNVILTFDLKLENYSATSNEKMRVDIWNGTDWIQITEFINNSNKPWTTYSYDVTDHAAATKTKVRFVAHGATSFNIHRWVIDNIRLEEILYPCISVSPDHFDEIMGSYHPVLNRTLMIENTGIGLLDFEINIEYLNDLIDWPPILSQNLEWNTFSPTDWISINPITDTVSPGNTLPVSVTFDVTSIINHPTPLAANLHIASNDPVHPIITVPIDIHMYINSVNEPLVSYLTVYPIPSRKVIYIECGIEIAQIRIIQLTGQIQNEFQVPMQKTIELDVAGYKPGIYVLQFHLTNGQLLSREIILTK